MGVARARIGPLTDKGGNICLQPGEIDENLNQYFILIFTSEEEDMEDGESREV